MSLPSNCLVPFIKNHPYKVVKKGVLTCCRVCQQEVLTDTYRIPAPCGYVEMRICRSCFQKSPERSSQHSPSRRHLSQPHPSQDHPLRPISVYLSTPETKGINRDERGFLKNKYGETLLCDICLAETYSPLQSDMYLYVCDKCLQDPTKVGPCPICKKARCWLHIDETDGKKMCCYCVGRPRPRPWWQRLCCCCCCPPKRPPAGPVAVKQPQVAPQKQRVRQKQQVRQKVRVRQKVQTREPALACA